MQPNALLIRQNFIVVKSGCYNHVVDVDHSVNFGQLKPWGLYFDGSVCSVGQGAGCVVVFP
jgi:hypothetical protein